MGGTNCAGHLIEGCELCRCELTRSRRGKDCDVVKRGVREREIEEKEERLLI